MIRIDLLGHGGSDKPRSGYEIGDQANASPRRSPSSGSATRPSSGTPSARPSRPRSPSRAPSSRRKVVNIDQATDDSFEELSFTAKLGTEPVIGQAMNRVSDIAPTSTVRSQFQQAFAPDFNIASGFDNPDQVVEDLNEMTYTAFVDVVDEEGKYSDARHLDDRLSALQIPVLVIFGAEDQIYDADAAIEPYRGHPGRPDRADRGLGPLAQRRDPRAARHADHRVRRRTDAGGKGGGEGREEASGEEGRGGGEESQG